MTKNSVWERSKQVKLKVAPEIRPGFDIGFDKRIPKDVADEMRVFVKWVEKNYSIPITLWVDFEYNHYLISRKKKRVGFLFYWADFTTYPVFDHKNDIPEIHLPVRTEHSTIEEILSSFIEAISLYFLWICNELTEDSNVDEDEVEEILQSYLDSRK